MLPQWKQQKARMPNCTWYPPARFDVIQTKDHSVVIGWCRWWNNEQAWILTVAVDRDDVEQSALHDDLKAIWSSRVEWMMSPHRRILLYMRRQPKSLWHNIFCHQVSLDQDNSASIKRTRTVRSRMTGASIVLLTTKTVYGWCCCYTTDNQQWQNLTALLHWRLSGLSRLAFDETGDELTKGSCRYEGSSECTTILLNFCTIKQKLNILTHLQSFSSV